MRVENLPEGIELTGYHAALDKPAFVFAYGSIHRYEQCTGSFFTCQPAPGYEFVYDALTDSYTPTRTLDAPVTYTITLQATTAAQLSEIQSLLDSIAKHTTTFRNIEREPQC